MCNIDIVYKIKTYDYIFLYFNEKYYICFVETNVILLYNKDSILNAFVHFRIKFSSRIIIIFMMFNPKQY